MVKSKSLLAKFIDGFEEIIAAFLLFLVFLIVLAEIATRAIWGFSLVWPDEVSRILFVWSVFIGTSAGFKHASLIKVDILYRLLPANIQKLLFALAHFLIAALLILLMIQGFILANKFAADTLPLSGLPQGYLYYSLPVSCILILLRVIQSLVVNFIQYQEDA